MYIKRKPLFNKDSSSGTDWTIWPIKSLVVFPFRSFAGYFASRARDISVAGAIREKQNCKTWNETSKISSSISSQTITSPIKRLMGCVLTNFNLNEVGMAIVGLGVPGRDVMNSGRMTTQAGYTVFGNYRLYMGRGQMVFSPFLSREKEINFSIVKL